MKIVFGGDTHGHTRFVDYLLDRAAAAGATHLLQVGDFGYWEHEHDGVKFLHSVNKLARRRGITVVFIDGNHDNVGLLRRTYTKTDDAGFVIVRDHVRYAPRGHRWTWNDVTFLALGGALSVDKDWRLEQEAKRTAKEAKKNHYRLAAGRPDRVRDFAETLWFPDEEITDAEADAVIAAAATAGPVDIMVTHDKPRAATLDRDREEYLRCLPNQDRIQDVMRAVTPKMLVHGHLHRRYTDWVRTSGERWTRIEGLGADDHTREEVAGYRPGDAWFVLDLTEGPASLETYLDSDPHPAPAHR